ncbi:hypothetical protein [Nocardia callitridis]|uniref:CsbD family protein n=1 Tax=Nocardia callitridis TaxID=648753 RepID=A0ABP9KTD3_9NOCA
MIGKFESNKDRIQELTSTGAKRVGNIASIITGTVAEVTREIGEWVTDVIEMNEAAEAARKDAAAQRDVERAATAATEADQPVRSESAADADKSRTTARFVDGEVVTPETADIIDVETIEDEAPTRGCDDRR